MAYQAKRKGMFTEDFELVEADGTVVSTLHVAVDPDSMTKKLSAKHVALIKAMQDIQTAESEQEHALETVGRAVTDMLEAVFGPEDAKTILDFYDNRHLELCTEVLPFIAGEVIPRVRSMAQENKKSVIAGYNRKARRIFGKG